MERSTFAVSFYCRQSKVTKKDGIAPIELSVNINGQRVFISLPRKMSPGQFSRDMAQRRGNQTKAFCESYRRKVDETVQMLIDKRQCITADMVKKYFFTNGDESEKLSDLWVKWHNANKGRVGDSLTMGVYRKYQLSINSLKAAIGDMALTDINSNHIQQWLGGLVGYDQSTVHGYYSKVKSLFNFGVTAGMCQHNPCHNMHVSKGIKDVGFLTELELRRIEQYHSGIERIEKVRDYFLFQCYSGMSFCDAARVDMADVANKDGRWVYVGHRQKTGMEYVVVLGEKAIGILRQYGGRLPKLSNQKMNCYLKELGDVCGISKPLHSHLGRHTAATMLLNKGVRMEVVAKALGHSNTDMTRRYAKLLDSTVISELAAVEI